MKDDYFFASPMDCCKKFYKDSHCEIVDICN
jgi:hypothetical protein